MLGLQPAIQAVGAVYLLFFQVLITLRNLSESVMQKSPKYRENSSMYEACAPQRGDHIREASEILQRLYYEGALCRRVKNAQDVLCKKPFAWTRNRVLEVFEGSARRIDSHEMDHLRALKRTREVEEAKNEQREIDELRARLARLEAALTVSDETFHRPQIEALRGSLRGLGGMVGRTGIEDGGDK